MSGPAQLQPSEMPGHDVEVKLTEYLDLDPMLVVAGSVTCVEPTNTAGSHTSSSVGARLKSPPMTRSSSGLADSRSHCSSRAYHFSLPA